ncbi:vaccinia C4L/C10L-like protein [Magpiepox virus 2]|nr:vaccinia C4L/C10L-like protein [Magpiepox virus 2]
MFLQQSLHNILLNSEYIGKSCHLCYRYLIFTKLFLEKSFYHLHLPSIYHYTILLFLNLYLSD